MGSLSNELHARGIDTFEKTKAEMQEKISSIVHGIQKPPALLCTDPQIHSMSYYEIPPCEPLHDFTNLVQNLKKDFQCTLKTSRSKRIEKFSSIKVGDKSKLKGFYVWLFAVNCEKVANQSS